MRDKLGIFIVAVCLLFEVFVSSGEFNRYPAHGGTGAWRFDPDAPKSLGGVVRVVLAPRPPTSTERAPIYARLTDGLPKLVGGLGAPTESSWTPVTLAERDVAYAKPSEALIKHIQRVLDRMNALRVTVHPRIRRLYELLKKDIIVNRPVTFNGHVHHNSSEFLDFSTRTGYSDNKLNRIYTKDKDVF